MVFFFIGTKAQFIKMAPVMVELNRRGVDYKYIDSGQHAELTQQLRQIFGINEPDTFLKQGNDITSIFQAFVWVVGILSKCVFKKKWIKKNIFIQEGICLIHGDTLSTLLGLKMAKAVKLKVAHVEAGLRSFNVFHPFPEEIIRIYCMKRCDVLFAPSQEAYDNLIKMKVNGNIVKMSGNTVVDSLRLMKNIPTTVTIPEVPFALATTHRMETITKKERLTKVVELLNKTSENIKVVFVTHKPTRKYLKKFGLLEKLSGRIDILDMQDYMNFIALMKAAKMVFADGGSIQEECAYLCKPCLVLRYKTERSDGIGNNVVLWKFNEKIAEEFLNTINTYVENSLENYPKPAKEIFDWLCENEI